MCWNKEVSFITFIIALMGAYYLYKRNGPNDRYIAIFGATIAMIQLAEFFMWIDQSCGNINMYASMFAIFILAIEPLISMVCGIYLTDASNKFLLKIMVGLYIIFVVYLFTFNYNKTINYCGISTSCDKSCHLKWKFVETVTRYQFIIWMAFLIVPLLFMIPRYQGAIMFITAIATYLMSRLYSGTVMASLWCWFAISTIYVKILI
jgi:hypothetical protein